VNPWSAGGDGNKGKDEGAGANVDFLWFSMVFMGKRRFSMVFIRWMVAKSRTIIYRW
jgi:hypothetical protein